jgi:hypothetical protein
VGAGFIVANAMAFPRSKANHIIWRSLVVGYDPRPPAYYDMKWNTEEFCRAWLNDKLGQYKKEKQGGFYTRSFNGNEFLCYLNQTGAYNSNPMIIAMKAPSGLMLMDYLNFNQCLPRNVSGEFRKKQPALYEVDFQSLNRETGDLAEIQEISCNQVPVSGGYVKVSLFEINGSIHYTDLAFFSACDTRDDYLSMRDYLEFPLFERVALFNLYRIPMACRDIKDARLYSAPPEAGEGEFLAMNDFFFVPAPDFDPNIPEGILSTARWRPGSLGWDLPDGLVSKDGILFWEWEQAQKKGMTPFMEKVETRFPDQKSRFAARKYMEAYKRWQDAHNYITKRIEAPRHISDASFEYAPGSCMCEDGDENAPFFLKGEIQEKDRYQEKSGNVLHFGNKWHKILKKGLRK